jgi:hypothetical protein
MLVILGFVALRRWIGITGARHHLSKQLPRLGLVGLAAGIAAIFSNGPCRGTRLPNIEIVVRDGFGEDFAGLKELLLVSVIYQWPEGGLGK